jgi:branched-chain amino acid transport system substrate-binding protein
MLSRRGAHGNRPWSRRLTAVVSAAVIAGSMLVAVATTATPAGAASATGTPIVIGDLCSCTGIQSSSVVLSTPTDQAWVSSVNANGGIAGHPVKVIEADDQTNPAVATTDIGKFIQTDHVAAIIDNSQEDSAWINAAVSAGVPVIGGVNSVLGYTNPDVYPSGSTLNYGIAGEDAGAAKAGIKTEAIFYCVEAASCKQITDLAGKVGQQFGIKVIYTSGISFTAPNYAAQCVAAKATGADSLETADANIVVEKAADNCATQGWHPVEVTATSEIGSGMATDPNFKTMVASMNDIPWVVHNSATKSMYAALDKYQPAVETSTNFGEQVVLEWANLALLHDAVAAAAPSAGTNVTGAVVKKGLYHLPAGDNLGGIAAQPIHFTKGAPANFNCWYYMGTKSGKFVWSNSHKPICAPLMKPGTAEGGPVIKN